MSLSVVITQEELNKESEQRIWHSAAITSNEAICGAKGKWVGAGLVVTCPICLSKLGDRAEAVTRYALRAPKLTREQIGRQRK